MATAPLDSNRISRAAASQTDAAGKASRNATSHDDATPGVLGDELPRPLGRYLLLRRLARGGMGEVFLASTMGIEGAERPVVVKVIRRDHSADPSFIARFLDEARVQAQLQHSGVAQVIEASLDDASGQPYAVVEHIEGKSLGDVRSRALALGYRVGWAEAVAVATMIAEALAHVHERKDPSGRGLAIVHRDLSPQNVMVSYAGDVKIIDFGTARGLNRRCRTVSGVVFAKPGYVAPEVANGDTGDARVDLYALGVMLWELCAGRRFLQGDAAVHMSAVAKNAMNLPPLAADIGAPIEIDLILAKLTAFDVDERYAAARLAARDLAKLLAAAPPLPGGERGVRARTANVMANLFPAEPGKSRREFARLVSAARAAMPAPSTKEEPAALSDAPTPGHGVLPGTRLRLVREIGGGASSVVHEAEHVDLGRRVAVKILAPEHGSSPEYAARFRREARAMSRLAHDGLVQLHDFGRAADGRLFCVMELLEGETVEAMLTRDRDVDWQFAARIGLRVLGTLEAAHSAGVVHRDVKPANIFLTKDGHVKVLDFGLAHTPEDIGEAVLGAPNGDNAVAAGFTLFGTPEYMAPEQAAGGRVDGRADLYALGCVLYEMITGQLPYLGASAAAIVDAKMKGSPERPRDRVPNKRLPDAVDELLMKALSRHPGLRFQNANEMRQALLSVLAAPARARNRRRAIGFSALATVMAFAAVLFVGKSHEIGRLIPQSLSLSPVAEQPALVAPASPEQPSVEDPAAAPVLALELEEEPIAIDDTPSDEPAPTVEEPGKDEVAAAARPRKRPSRSPGSSRSRAASPSYEPEIEDQPELVAESESESDFDIVVEELDEDVSQLPRTVVVIEPVPGANDDTIVAGGEDAASSEPATQPAQVVAEAPEPSADKPEPAPVAKAEPKPKPKTVRAGGKDKAEQARLRRKRKTRMASKATEGSTASKPAGRSK
ncbi:MAG: protein kinase [Polyangiaceae bacterium]|nr:protein kinase [Polyangiaceae bacterium]